MASITTRAGKGSALTNAEVDANFTNLNTELGQKLEASALSPYLLSATAASTYQTVLVSGTSIKTVNGQSVLGSGNIQIDGGVTSFNTRTGAVSLTSGDVTTALGYTPLSSAGGSMTSELAISVNSSNPALRVTQAGSGFVIQIDDAASDTTPFVVRADGRTVIGGTTNYGIAGLTTPQLTVNEGEAVISAATWNAGGSGFNASLQLNRSRSGTQGTYTIVQSGDLLGVVRFGGDDGTQFVRAADIFAVVDGTPGVNSMPGRLVLSTTADGASSPTERIRIDSRGRSGFATTTSPLAYLDIRGNKGPTNVNALEGYSSAFTATSDVTSTATSFSSFINPGDNAALAAMTHFGAAQRTFGAGSSVTVQTGFEAAASLTGATTNYGFRGRLTTGTGRWNLFMDGTASNHLAGPLGINTTFLNDYLLRVGGNISGATTRGAAEINVTAQSDVTAEARGIVSAVSTAASAFTVGQTSAFFASQGTIGASSTINTQVGFLVSSNFTGGTNNYGFRGAIASGANRFNLYMDGTAANFLAGGLIINNNLGVGTAGSPSYGTSGQVLTSQGPGAAPTWTTVSAGGGGGTLGQIVETAATITSNYSIAAGNNGFSVGPVTIQAGVAVTVPAGRTWLIANTVAPTPAGSVTSGKAIAMAIVFGA